jgi:transposase-like protein
MEKELYTPKTVKEAIRYFADPAICLQYMIPLRWPNGITCPHCQGVEHSFISTRQIWRCKACKKQFSIKTQSIMEDSPLSLDVWLVAMWLIANAKNGISSHELSRALGVTQKSCWFLAHRIRLAFETGTFEKMSGQIECDETFVGGLAKNMHADKREALIQGRGPVNKAIVFGMLERNEEKGASQVSAAVIPDRSAETLEEQVYSIVELKSEIITDEWVGYQGLSPDYIHHMINHSKEYARGEINTNSIENFWTLFKRCLKGTWVSVEDDHLHRYVAEQEFRFNERGKRGGKDKDRFVKVVSNINGKRITYKQLIDRGSAPLPRRGRIPNRFKHHEENTTKAQTD